jgi:hypothetical protein
MFKLTLEVKCEKKEELKYALQEALKQAENGYTGGDLRNEDFPDGWWDIKEIFEND